MRDVGCKSHRHLCTVSGTKQEVYTEASWRTRLDVALYMSCCCHEQIRAHVCILAVACTVQALP